MARGADRLPWPVTWPVMLVLVLTFPLVWLLVMLMRPRTAPTVRIAAVLLAISLFAAQLVTARLIA